MARYFSTQIKCPHCAIENTLVLDMHMRMHGKPQMMLCWNSEKQEGCKQKMQVTVSIQIETRKVKAEFIANPQKMFLKPVYEEEEAQK